MSKKVKTLIAFGVAAVVLIGAFLALVVFLPEKEEQNILDNGEQYSIFNEVGSKLESITIDYQGDHYVIEELSQYYYGIAKIEDYADPSDFSTVSTGSYSMGTYNKMEKVEDLSVYGLDNPQATVTFAFDNAAKHTLYIGNANSAENGHYAKLKDSDDVYVLQSQTTNLYLRTSHSYILPTVVEAFDTNDESAYPVFSYFEVERKDLEKNIYIRPMTSEEKKSDVALTAIMKMTSPVNALVLNDAVQTEVYGFFGLQSVSCVSYEYTDAMATEYGFDDPTAVVRTKFDNTEMTLTLGKPVDEAKTQYYIHSTKKEDLVFIVNASDLPWLTMTPDEIVSPVAVQPYIMDLESVSVQINKGKTHVFTFEHEKTEEGKTSSDIFCEGKQLDETNFKRYLQLLMYTSGESIHYGEPADTNNEVLEIRYVYNNGASEDVVRILKNTARYGVMEVNGFQNFTARLAYIDKLQTELDKLFAGEKIDTEW